MLIYRVDLSKFSQGNYMTNKQPAFQSLSKIRNILEMTHIMLEESKEQLRRMREAKEKPHILDNDIVDRSLKLYKDQNEDSKFFIKQCNIWKQEKLTELQAIRVKEIEYNANLLTEINNKLFSIFNYCKDRTINKIMEKEDNLLDQLVFNTSTNRVFIFTVNLTSYINNISKCWECLSVKEKIQANKYYTKSLSDKYIMSHGILRYIRSHYTKQYPKEIEFTHNEYGKPFLKNSNIYFNMSHSHNMVTYIVALNQRVGIDIELHDNNLNVQELASLVLTSAESQYLSSLNSKEKFALFYHLWTKKESLIKANGQGLSYPINTIEAIALPSGSTILLTNEKKLQQEYYYYELETIRNYSGAIAIENKIDEIVYLEMNNPPNIFGNIKLKCLA